MHKTTIFIIQLCVVELFSLKDACGFIAETASFYVMVESGGSMRMPVNTMVITLNICMAIRELSETDINSDALLLVVMALL